MRKKIIPLAADDRRYFQEFYQQYRGFILYCAQRHFTGGVELDDLLQEVLDHLMGKVSTLRKLNKFKIASYINATVRGILVDHMRSAPEVEILTLDCDTMELLLEIEGYYSQVSMDSSAHWDAEYLKSQLSEKEWQILYGKHMIGLSDEELAAKHGYHASSMRVILNRIRKKSQQILLGADAEEGGEEHEEQVPAKTH